jgi:hypothetical protein
MWVAAGALTRLRSAALLTHIRQTRSADADPQLPGSYSWPRLRAEAERRFAAGEDPRRVIEELRRRHRRGTARAPSVRTMRRWYTQARWLPPSRRAHARPAARNRRWQPLPEYALLPEALRKHLPRVVEPSWLWDP